MTPPPVHLLRTPSVHPAAFIAPGAVVLGDVTVAENASIWYNAVLRGDINRITVGQGSNVQDGAVLHLSAEFGCHIGSWVTVGHMAMLHACTIGDECLIGMGSIILDGAEIGARSIVAAGAVVTQGKKIPPGSMVMGTPGKVVRTLTDEEQSGLREWAERYVRLIPHYHQLGLAAPAFRRDVPDLHS